MIDSGWLEAYKWALIVAVAGQTLFMIVYGTRPWWKHYVGKALFFKSLALCIALWVSFTNVVVGFNSYRWQVPISVISIWLIAVTIVGQCIALIIQVGHTRHETKERKAHEFSPE